MLIGASIFALLRFHADLAALASLAADALQDAFVSSSTLLHLAIALLVGSAAALVFGHTHRRVLGRRLGREVITLWLTKDHVETERPRAYTAIWTALSTPSAIVLGLVSLLGLKHVFGAIDLLSLATFFGVLVLGVIALLAYAPGLRSLVLLPGPARVENLMELARQGGRATSRAAVLQRLGEHNRRMLLVLYECCEGQVRALTNTIRSLAPCHSPEAIRLPLSYYTATNDAAREHGYAVAPLASTDPRELLDLQGRASAGRDALRTATEDTLLSYAAEAFMRHEYYVQQRNVRLSRPTADPNRVTASSLEQEDGDNICLDSLVPTPGGSGFRLACSIARYGQIMRSNDALIEEFLLLSGVDALETTARPVRALRPSCASILAYLPWRNTYLRSARTARNGAFLHPGQFNPACGLGISTTIVIPSHPTSAQHTHSYRALFIKRSQEVGTYPGFYHALPAGMFNAKHLPLDRHSLFRIVASEFLEEARNRKRLEGTEGGRSWLEILHAELRTFLSCRGEIICIPISNALTETPPTPDDRAELTYCKSRLEEFGLLSSGVLDPLKTECIRTSRARRANGATISSSPYVEVLCRQSNGLPGSEAFDVRIAATQLVFDFLNMRPDVCLIAFINDSTLPRRLEGNWETTGTIYDQETAYQSSELDWVRSGRAAYMSTLAALKALGGNLSTTFDAAYGFRSYLAEVGASTKVDSDADDAGERLLADYALKSLISGTSAKGP